MAHRPARLLSLSHSTGLARLLSLAALMAISAPVFGSELRQTPIVKAVQQAAPSVVNIRGEKTVGPASLSSGEVDSGRRVNGMGTGVVVDSRGYIVTNYHVVDGVREIQVKTADQRQYTATLVDRDPETDLAIIKIDSPEPLPVIRIGSSADLMPGEPVVAVGNAYGYEHTVTRGIISALHRSVQVSDAQYYDDLIQTDASINPGNSGGPLLNIDGDMIGINVAVRAGAQGIGFAIPVDKAIEVAADLLASGSASSCWHGLQLETECSRHGSRTVVATVDNDSPAAEAGIEPGDVIDAVDDQPVARSLDFHRALLDHSAGQKVDISVTRDGDAYSMTVELADVPAKPRQTGDPTWDVLGLRLKPIDSEEFRQSHHTRYRGGLTVTSVRDASPADNQGIRRGDVLVGMHIWETISLENVSYIIGRPNFTELNPVKFFILRGSETLYGYLPVSMR